MCPYHVVRARFDFGCRTLAIVFLVTEKYSFAFGTVSISLPVQKLFLLPVLPPVSAATLSVSRGWNEISVVGHFSLCSPSPKGIVLPLEPC